MNRRVFCRSALFAFAALASGQTLLAASPGTVIEVENMHCSNCARKIASKLYGVPGVVVVRTSVTANTATVTPQQQRQPSPKAMWEAVERAGFKPVKLQGPQGSFTSKPRV